MNPNETGGRHRRRRTNSVTRAALDEARRAGLVQRHLTKLRYLTSRPEPGTAGGPLAEPVRSAGGGGSPPSTREQLPPTTAAGEPAPGPIPPTGTESAA
ncbi:hypothetical protein Q5425_23805 [Amycolatopsis sp. A133]|uniref:hypothetical protein n=1 Tax=Amycolatopsis sp. A133 TaxID=3064472 RepID=UPI0027E791D1|nr:hypothetical protein [Amycolatopsis sp. A133]MDQ7806777.1 hypothetical protein [Amycolatopsis sp. A133]